MPGIHSLGDRLLCPRGWDTLWRERWEDGGSRQRIARGRGWWTDGPALPTELALLPSERLSICLHENITIGPTIKYMEVLFHPIDWILSVWLILVITYNVTMNHNWIIANLYKLNRVINNMMNTTKLTNPCKTAKWKFQERRFSVTPTHEANAA